MKSPTNPQRTVYHAARSPCYGRVVITIHVEHAHVTVNEGDSAAVLAAIAEMRNTIMSALTDAVARVGAAYSAQTALLNQALAALDQALANDANDAQLISDLTAQRDSITSERDALAAEAAAAVAALANIAPEPTDPPVEPTDVIVEPVDG